MINSKHRDFESMVESAKNDVKKMKNLYLNEYHYNASILPIEMHLTNLSDKYNLFFDGKMLMEYLDKEHLYLHAGYVAIISSLCSKIKPNVFKKLINLYVLKTAMETRKIDYLCSTQRFCYYRKWKREKFTLPTEEEI